MLTAEPYSNDVWHESELWSRDRIEANQLAALKRQLLYVGERSAYYQRIFRQTGFDPRDFKAFEDLRALPVTNKLDYVNAIPEAPPWGPFVACDPKDILRVHFSSGTTAKPVHMCWTEADIERWADLFARYFYAQGVRRGDLYQAMVSFSWFVGGMAVALAVQRVGAALIPAGNADSERQIDTVLEFGVNAIFATPSFAAHLAEVAARMGRDLTRSKLKTIMVGGEPGGGLAGTRARIERNWGAKTYDCYGMIEFQPTAWETEVQDGLILAEDFVYAEVLDPTTLVPVPDGTPGVLVLTHLDKQACPLIRWSTGDVVVRDSRPGTDRRTMARLVGGVQGRVDDMLVVRGVNLFPSAVERVLRAVPGVGAEFQIVLDESLKDSAGFWTGIRLRAEADDGDPATIGPEIARRIREQLTVSAQVEVLPFGTLPRAMHKAKRVVDQ